MSKLYTLVRFLGSGNIYYGSYDTTGEIAGNYICTPDEACEAADDIYDKNKFWEEKRKRDKYNSYVYECLLGTEDGCEDVEVYVSNLRASFLSRGNEQRKLISGWSRGSSPVRTGIPNWVKEFEHRSIGIRRKEQRGALKKFDERMMEVNSKPLPKSIREYKEREEFKKRFGSSRDLKRIEDFCETLKEVWSKVPNWRFGQLVSNIVKSAEMTPQTFFYIEDDKMKEILEQIISSYTKYDVDT